jgi:hypothetical protein
MKKFLLLSLGILFWLWLGSIIHANNFQIIPEVDEDKQDVVDQQISQPLLSGDNFWDNYNNALNKVSKEPKKYGDKLAVCMRTGVCGRDVLLDVGVYLLRFIMQLALVVGAGMLIWSGYSYVLVAMGAQDKPEEASKAIKNAIIWLFIISISYTLIKLLQMAFLS